MYDIAPSDQRAIHLDFNIIVYLKDPNLQSSINIRHLSTKYPVSTRTYKTYVESYFKNDIITKVQSIQNMIYNTTIDEMDLPFINIVDKLTIKRMMLAKKNTKRSKFTHRKRYLRNFVLSKSQDTSTRNNI